MLCDTTHSYVTRLSRMLHSYVLHSLRAHSYVLHCLRAVLHDLFTYDLSHSYVLHSRYDAFICVALTLRHIHMCCTHAITHSYVLQSHHDAFICVALTLWRIHTRHDSVVCCQDCVMCNMPHLDVCCLFHVGRMRDAHLFLCMPRLVHTRETHMNETVDVNEACLVMQ